MERRSYIGLNHFEKINLPPVKNKVNQCNFKNNLSPVYISDIYTLNSFPIVKTRRSMDSFVEPMYVDKISRKSISYLRSKIWSGLDRNIKNSTFTNSFKHAFKKQFLKKQIFLTLLRYSYYDKEDYYYY